MKWSNRHYHTHKGTRKTTNESTKASFGSTLCCRCNCVGHLWNPSALGTARSTHWIFGRQLQSFGARNTSVRACVRPILMRATTALDKSPIKPLILSFSHAFSGFCVHLFLYCWLVRLAQIIRLFALGLWLDFMACSSRGWWNVSTARLWSAFGLLCLASTGCHESAIYRSTHSDQLDGHCVFAHRIGRVRLVSIPKRRKSNQSLWIAVRVLNSVTVCGELLRPFEQLVH